jgi:hypothetical protein
MLAAPRVRVLGGITRQSNSGDFGVQRTTINRRFTSDFCRDQEQKREKLVTSRVWFLLSV